MACWNPCCFKCRSSGWQPRASASLRVELLSSLQRAPALAADRRLQEKIVGKPCPELEKPTARLLVPGDEPELWRPRGTEVPAARQAAELARSPLHGVAGLIGGWGLRLFFGRYFLPQVGRAPLGGTMGTPRLFARVAHLLRATETLVRRHAGDGAGGAGPLGSYRATATLMPSLRAKPAGKLCPWEPLLLR